MGRTISGSKYKIPDGLPPLVWANEVWTTMDELGVSESEAKTIVAARYELQRERDIVAAGIVEAELTRALYEKLEEQPAVDKMVKQSRNKGF